MKALDRKISSCNKCVLCKNRRNAVPGKGNPRAKVMFIGEAPGRIEDLEGKPFMGRAGRFLNVQIWDAGMEKDEVFMTNVVKCRPPGNRKPKKDEIEACSAHLDEQIRAIGPKIVVLMGNVAVKTVLGEKYSVSKHHGKAVRRKGTAYLPMPHPSAALRFPVWKKRMQQDFVVLKNMISRT